MPPRSARRRRGSTGRVPAAVEHQVQGLAPFPGAWFEVERRADQAARRRVADGDGRAGRSVRRPLTIACGEGAIRPTLVQRAGRAPMAPTSCCAAFPSPRARSWRDPLAADRRCDGAPFMGWQRQDHGPSVQAALERRSAMTGETATVHAAGRTDAGVHALAMAAHVDIAKPLTAHRLREGLNALVRPDPVAVLAAEPVADDWHARFSCIGRRYLYRIANRRAPLTLDAGRPGASRPRSTSTRWREGALLSRRPPRFHHLSLGPLPVGQPGQDARPPDGRARGRRNPCPCRGAQLPASPGAVDGRLPGAGRAGGEWRRGGRRQALAGAAEGCTAPRSGLNAPPEGLYFVEAPYP